MATLAQLLDRLSPNAQLRGKQFEYICKWYLENDPKYRNKLKKVWLWDEWPGRRAADAGIDLIAEDDQGGLWAIQAKAYHPDYSVKKADVDTFISAAAPRLFSYRLLIATTNLIGHNARRTMGDNDAGMVMRADLERDQLSWPTSPDKLRPATPKPKKPRRHQKQAMAAVISGFKENDRGQLLMACGTGKTLTAAFIAEELASRRVLVLVPSLSLLSQTIREWTANSARPFKFISVCSDQTVWDEEDQWVSNTSELGFPVTTDPRAIATFLRRPGPSVVFSTYQSSPRIAEAFDSGRVPKFDLAIADEAHRCAGRISMDFATVLNGGAIKADRRLFMTATPRYFTGRVQKAAKEADYEVASMDDEDTFGPVFHQLNFGEAIARDLLSDYQVVIVGVDDPTYRAYAENGTFVTTDGTAVTDARTLASHIGLAKAMKKYDLRRAITFHGRVTRARDFANDFPGVVKWMPARQRPPGSLWTDHVSGAMPSGQRDIRLERLRHLAEGERGLLANARCLGEGVDVPTLDGVAFVDPRRSQVDIVQAVGRAIRKDPGKRVGTIVLPVFIGDTADPEAALKESAFQPVWDVLKALRAHDEELGEELDDLRREVGRLGVSEPRLPGKLKIELPMAVGREFIRAFESRLVEQSTASWEFWFGLLERYETTNGNTLVPQLYRMDGLRLGGWVNEQRLAFRRGHLDQSRRERLETCRGWVWNPQESAWEEGFENLVKFAAREGHAIVGPRHVEDRFKLGQWVQMQRTGHNAGTLGKTREKRLAAVNGWSWDPREDRWRVAIRALRSFIKREGHALVSARHREGQVNLGAWVNTQRTRYAAGELAQDRLDELNAIHGWVWSVAEASWDANYVALVDFSKTHGHALVAKEATVKGRSLGSWVSKQRRDRSWGRLSTERVALLNAVDGWVWNATEAKWEEGFQKLQAYTARAGDALVSARHVEDGYPLGSWVNNNRVSYRNGALDEKYIARLEAIDGWSWNPQREGWEAAYGLLQKYVARTGDALVPQSHEEDGFNLGGWVTRQRSLQTRSKMSVEDGRRLEQVDGWSWDPIGDRWNAAFDLLEQYERREGHARVPRSHVEDGFPLGRWVDKQRVRRETLSEERIARLEALADWAGITRRRRVT